MFLLFFSRIEAQIGVECGIKKKYREEGSTVDEVGREKILARKSCVV